MGSYFQVSHTMFHFQTPTKGANGGSTPKPGANAPGFTPPTDAAVDLTKEVPVPRKKPSSAVVPSKKRTVSQDVTPPRTAKASKNPKKKLKPRNLSQSVPTYSGGGGKQYITEVIVLSLFIPGLWLVLPEQPGNVAAYMQPFVTLVQNMPEIALDDFHIIGIYERLDRTDPELNLPMKQKPGVDWPWKVLAFFRNGEETVEEFAKFICNKLTLWANTSDDWKGSNNLFIYRKSSQVGYLVPRPVNYYIRMRDTLLLLKKVYGGQGVTKADIEQDEDVLTQFFGTVDKGRRVLGQLNEIQWQHLQS